MLGEVSFYDKKTTPNKPSFHKPGNLRRHIICTNEHNGPAVQHPTSCSRCKTVFKMVSALHVLKVKLWKTEAIIIADARGCKKPAADLHLICSWYERDRQTGGQAAVDGACTNSRRKANANLHKNCVETWICGFKCDTITEYIYGRCAGLSLGSESNTGVFRQRCGHSQQTAPTVRLQSASIPKHQSLTLFACFHPVKAITGKKKKKKILRSDNLWQLSTHNFELLCHKQKRRLPHFHGSQHTPTPPLRALRLRWMAYLHSHVTPRGKGARLCASLTRSAAALALPLFFSTPRLGCCLGKPLLSLQPCPSVGRTGRLCPGENTEHLCGALCF